MTNQAVLDDDDREKRRQEIEAEEADRELAKKNHNFLQVTRDNIEDLIFLSKDSPAAFDVMLAMVKRMNRSNGLMISQETLAEITNRNKRTIIRAINYLREHQWLDVINVGTANAYIINSKVFWMGERDKRQTAFIANVIAAEKEQKQPIRNVKLKHFPVLYPQEQVTLIGNQHDQKDLDL